MGAIGIAIAVVLVVFGYTVLTEDEDGSDGQVAQSPEGTATPSPTATASPIPSPAPATPTPEATAEATVESTEEPPPTPVITQEPEPPPVEQEPSPVEEEPPPLPSEEPPPERPTPAEDNMLLDAQCSDARLDAELYRILISGASLAGLPTDYLEQNLAEAEAIANSPQCEGRGLVPVYTEHLASLCATAGEFHAILQQSLLFLDPALFSAMQLELAKLDAFEQGYCGGY
jgi:outer membrane biosynthesis protein TonB